MARMPEVASNPCTGSLKTKCSTATPAPDIDDAGENIKEDFVFPRRPVECLWQGDQQNCFPRGSTPPDTKENLQQQPMGQINRGNQGIKRRAEMRDDEERVNEKEKKKRN